MSTEESKDSVNYPSAPPSSPVLSDSATVEKHKDSTFVKCFMKEPVDFSNDFHVCGVQASKLDNVSFIEEPVDFSNDFYVCGVQASKFDNVSFMEEPVDFLNDFHVCGERTSKLDDEGFMEEPIDFFVHFMFVVNEQVG